MGTWKDVKEHKCTAWWVISVIIMWLIFAGVIACTASCCVYGIASFIEKHFFVKKTKRKMSRRQIDRVLEIYDEIDDLFDSDSGRSSRQIKFGTEITRLSATDEGLRHKTSAANLV